ncbi:hypothetical protein CHS0354_043134 [Potamilus streckersoni]|uniref:Uncharacterized protein n=1 Tax=Potamilus streckersoni TaxID=2493646 RepID=A0AAE0SC57_9BIVA|nr:hypothetical protein CHS0354_043134 [Potamilus streckersoni]
MAAQPQEVMDSLSNTEVDIDVLKDSIQALNIEEESPKFYSSFGMFRAFEGCNQGKAYTGTTQHIRAMPSIGGITMLVRMMPIFQGIIQHIRVMPRIRGITQHDREMSAFKGSMFLSYGDISVRSVTLRKLTAKGSNKMSNKYMSQT